jgi:hypothetical protein
LVIPWTLEIGHWSFSVRAGCPRSDYDYDYEQQLDSGMGAIMFARVNWGSFGFYREGRGWSFFDDPATCD